MKALLVIDMQVGCFSTTSPRRDAEDTIFRINTLANAIRKNGFVVFVQHTEALDGLAKGSKAWELLPSLDRSADDMTLEKTACDSFLETELHAFLIRHGVTELIITGCATDFCVDTTVRTAGALGFGVVVASDAHTTSDRPHLSAEKIIEHHNYMWAELLLPKQARVKVVDTRALLIELTSA